MTLITLNTTDDAKPTASAPATEWARVAVAFARLISLQVTEWMKLQKLGVKVSWRMLTVPYKSSTPATATDSGSGTHKVLAVYFYVPDHVISLVDQMPLLNDVPLTEIVLATIKEKKSS